MTVKCTNSSVLNMNSCVYGSKNTSEFATALCLPHKPNLGALTMDSLQVEDELSSGFKRSTKMQNPYTSRSMVKNIEYFFGRAEALETIFGNIGSCQHTSIVGERRIGKSSLLWHITE